MLPDCRSDGAQGADTDAVSDEDDACGCSEYNERGGGSVDSSDGRSACDIDMRDEFASAENGGEGSGNSMGFSDGVPISTAARCRSLELGPVSARDASVVNPVVGSVRSRKIAREDLGRRR